MKFNNALKPLRITSFWLLLIFGFTLASLSISHAAQARNAIISEPCQITKITDGDTVHVRCGVAKEVEKVRLSDIDAPERGQAFGKRAEENLGRLCDKQTATLDRRGRDRYGRTLATLYCGKIDVNARQVETGYAWVYAEYVTSDRAGKLYALEKTARREKRGLWLDPNPMPPSEFRKMMRQYKPQPQVEVKKPNEKKAKAAKNTQGAKPKNAKPKTQKVKKNHAEKKTKAGKSERRSNKKRDEKIPKRS